MEGVVHYASHPSNYWAHVAILCCCSHHHLNERGLDYEDGTHLLRVQIMVSVYKEQDHQFLGDPPPVQALNPPMSLCKPDETDRKRPFDSPVSSRLLAGIHHV